MNNRGQKSLSTKHNANKIVTKGPESSCAVKLRKKRNVVLHRPLQTR